MITEEHELVVSQLVLDEFEDVLRRKLNASETDLENALMLVDEAEVIPDVPTPDRGGYQPTKDTQILLTASAGHVDFVVTGDRGMQAQALAFGIQAVSPRGLLELMSQTPGPYPIESDDEAGPVVSDSSSDTTRQRAFDFAVAIVQLCRQLEDQRHYVLAKQLLRAGTSVGANIEEAGAAQSRRDFLHKMAIASKEARETNYWLRLLDESSTCPEIDLGPYLDRSLELIRLLTAIVKTTARTVR